MVVVGAGPYAEGWGVQQNPPFELHCTHELYGAYVGHTQPPFDEKNPSFFRAAYNQACGGMKVQFSYCSK